MNHTIAAIFPHSQLELDLEPSQFIVIGDTPNDIACARHFGARALAVGTGRFYDTEEILACDPDAFLPDLSNLDLVMDTLENLYRSTPGGRSRASIGT